MKPLEYERDRNDEKSASDLKTKNTIWQKRTVTKTKTRRPLSLGHKQRPDTNGEY